MDSVLGLGMKSGYSLFYFKDCDSLPFFFRVIVSVHWSAVTLLASLDWGRSGSDRLCKGISWLYRRVHQPASDLLFEGLVAVLSARDLVLMHQRLLRYFPSVPWYTCHIQYGESLRLFTFSVRATQQSGSGPTPQCVAPHNNIPESVT